MDLRSIFQFLQHIPAQMNQSADIQEDKHMYIYCLQSFHQSSLLGKHQVGCSRAKEGKFFAPLQKKNKKAKLTFSISYSYDRLYLTYIFSAAKYS